MNKKSIFILGIICLISFFFSYFRKTEVPPCINTDEATFTYNAYSILKTGRDEYGKILPLRFKSFGDYKMPLQFYISIPAVILFGLTDLSARFTNSFLALLFPLAIYFLTVELFGKKRIGLLAAFLMSTSFGIQMLSRQQHEGYGAGLLITATSFFFIKTLKKINWKNSFFFFWFLLLSLFAYHSSRLFAIFFFAYTLIYFFIKKIRARGFILVFVAVLGLFFITDLIYKPERINNLLFFKDLGIELTVNELRGEGGPRYLYNKITVSGLKLFFEYLKYFSPQFLAINGDDNIRFGFKNLSPVTPVVYIFLFVGLYFLFKKKEKEKFFILTIFLVAPLTASLAWATTSLTRSFFILVPAVILAAYGFYCFIESLPKKCKFLVAFPLVLLHLILLVFVWDFYFNHYSKRSYVVRSWQCGNKEMAEYVAKNYDRFDHFYITKKNGQPYIFLLFYLKYPPKKYQPQAELSPVDKFGFGQVEKFDKFIFNIKPTQFLEKRAVTIGYPGEFPSPIGAKKIKVGDEDIFWVFESP